MENTQFSTFDIEKIKKLRGQPSGANDSSVEWYSNHNKNRDTSRTANPEMKHLNISRGDAVSRVNALWTECEQNREKLGLRKMRKDSVKGVEVMLGASQEFFKKNKKGEWKVDTDWLNASKNWAINHYKGKGKLVQMDLTRDERGGPKLKMIFAPINDETNSFSADKFVGNRKDIKNAQKSYAKLMHDEFGLTPPTTGSTIKNNKKVDSEITEEARITNHEARVAENKRIKAEKELKNAHSELKTLTSDVDALKANKVQLTAENDALKVENKEQGHLLLKIHNAFEDLKVKLTGITIAYYDILDGLTPKHGTIQEKLESANSDDLSKVKDIIMATASALESIENLERKIEVDKETSGSGAGTVTGGKGFGNPKPK